MNNVVIDELSKQTLSDQASVEAAEKTEAVLAAVETSSAGSDALRLLSERRDEAAAALGAIVDAAKHGDRGAMAKLRAFETTSDPALAMKLVLMNRAQRQRFRAEVKAAARRKKTKHKR